MLVFIPLNVLHYRTPPQATKICCQKSGATVCHASMVTTLCRLASSFFPCKCTKLHSTFVSVKNFQIRQSWTKKKTANVNEFIDGKQEKRKTRVGRLND